MLAGERHSLIEGGIGARPSTRRSRRRTTARVAAPLLVPLALAITLGIILAVSASSPPASHVTQMTSSNGNP
jgi:hypothetical protein